MWITHMRNINATPLTTFFYNLVRRHGRDGGNSERREDKQMPTGNLRAFKVGAVAQRGCMVGFGGAELETES